MKFLIEFCINTIYDVKQSFEFYMKVKNLNSPRAKTISFPHLKHTRKSCRFKQVY